MVPEGGKARTRIPGNERKTRTRIPGNERGKDPHPDPGRRKGKGWTSRARTPNPKGKLKK